MCPQVQECEFELEYFIKFFCNRWRSWLEKVKMSAMKGWFTFGLATIAFGAVVFSTVGCSENSGWNAGMNGMPIQGDNPGVDAGTAPSGSGAVDYIPQGNE
jgi:hypothetical protein